MLLASEQRAFDAANRERDTILSLQRAVEQRTDAKAFVPMTQTVTPGARDTEIPVAFDKETRCFEVMQRRGVPHAHDQGADRLSLGRLVRGLAFGDRRGLSDLEVRVMNEGTDSAGGFTVPDIVGAQFIDRMRNAMVVMKVGAQTVPMTTDTLNIARLASGPTLAWHAENAPITPGDLVLERVQFIARTLPVLVKMSVELQEDSTNIDAVIERELAEGLAGELDRVALRGSGTPPEPKGIRFQTGVTIQAMATDGLAPTNYDPLIDAMAAITTATFARQSRAIYNTARGPASSS